MLERNGFLVQLIISFFLKFYNQLTEYFSSRLFFFYQLALLRFQLLFLQRKKRQKKQETVKLVLSLSYENFNPLWRNIFHFPWISLVNDGIDWFWIDKSCKMFNLYIFLYIICLTASPNLKVGMENVFYTCADKLTSFKIR